MPQPAFDLAATYVRLADGPSAVPVDVGQDFWATIDSRPDLLAGRLVAVFHFGSLGSWPHWEVHPAGDELVCLLSGAIDLVLEEEGGERVVPLRDRAACIVPRGVWHRGIVHQPGDALFITRGAGTQHRPV
jgi:mannose-6-phosphate isomerase-like protein (cupin superfamily)